MEYLKELLKPKTFNKISYVAVICWISFGVILFVIFAEMENSESRFDFRCAAKSETMDLIRGKCFEQYEKKYNKSGVPVYAFVIVNFTLVGIVGVIYSQVVKSRVDQLLAANRRRDAERQNDNPSEGKRRLFLAYLCQLATRFAMGIVFIVLQTQVLYPDNFPSDFPCLIAKATHAANASSTSNIQNGSEYECHNQRATKKTFWMHAVRVVNGAFVLIVLLEIICILSRARKGKKFLEDFQFLADHLPPREQEDSQQSEIQKIQQQEDPQTSEDQKLQEREDSQESESQQPQQQEDPQTSEDQKLQEREDSQESESQQPQQQEDSQTSEDQKLQEREDSQESESQQPQQQEDSQTSEDQKLQEREDSQESESQQPQQQENSQTSEDQELQEHEVAQKSEYQEPQQLPFIESLKESIKRYTEKPTDLKALFQKEHGETTRNEDLKIDSIYTNLVLIPERARYDFSGNREKQLKVYPKPEGNSQSKSRKDIVDVENKKVLIVGRPGIGKTLFSTKLLRDWAFNRRLFNAEVHFDFAFLLKFRGFNSEEKLSLLELFSRAEFLPDELFEFSLPKRGLSDKVWSHIVKNPDKLLILFDGFDEFSDISSFRANQPVSSSTEQPMLLSALFYNIVEGHLLRGATVLTTTRPTAVSDLTGFDFDKTFEILGFASEQVEEYVDNFTKNAAKKDTGKKIWQHISTNMNIFTLCYVPVNLFIVCSCLLEVLNFENLSTGVGLPTKLTHIYQMATKLFFFRHNEQYRDKRLHREDIESKEWPPEFKPLAKIAFDGIRERKLIFSSNEVSKDVVESALFHRLPDRKTAPFKHETQFCFIHLTMQEFLAAKHIVDTMKEAELRRFVADHINKGEWQMVMQFVAGLLGDGDKPSVDIFTELLPERTDEKDEGELTYEYNLENSVERRTVTSWPTDSETHLAVTLMKCIYENNESGSVVQSKLGEIGFNAVDFSNCHLAPADCAAVVHVLKSCQQISLIDLWNNNIGSLGCVEIVKLFDNGNCKLSCLILRRNNITVEGVKQLSNALVKYNCKLSSLNLQHNNITVEGVKQLSNALVNNNCKLSSLNLWGNNITDEGVKQLSNALVNNNCKLSSLNLAYNKITDEGVKQLSNALVNNNCKLSSLNLGYNKITDEGAKQLSNALVNNNCELSTLNLEHNNITDEGAMQLSNALVNNNCKLSSLHLGFSNITDEGVKQLSNALVNNDCKLSSLNLRDNNITVEGVKQLSNALVNNNCTLSTLNLGDNNITDEGVKQSSNALVNNNCKLSSLNLRDNNITVEGVKQLSNALVNNNCTLSTLNLGDNNITDEGVKQLSNALVNNNCKLSSLNLWGNNITDEGVKQLSNALVNNNKLRSLYLFGNKEITNEAKEQIKQANPNCKVIISIV